MAFLDKVFSLPKANGENGKINDKEKLGKPMTRRTFLIGAIIIAASAACESQSHPEPTPTSRVTPVVIDTPTPLPQIESDQSNPKYSEELRPGIRININGEDGHDINITADSLPEISYRGFEPGISFSRKEISLESDTNLAIVEIATDGIIDFEAMLKRIYPNGKTILNNWAKELGLGENSEFRFPKGNHTITLSDAVIQAGDGNIYLPFAEFNDTNLKLFSSLVFNHKRQVLSVEGGQGGYTLMDKQADRTDSLIGINIPASVRMREIYKLSGINLSESEDVELTIANEFASLFLDNLKRNDKATYDKFIGRLKDKYKFPPDNNPEFERNLGAKAKLLNVSIESLRASTASEALTTVFMYDYMKVNFNK